MRLMFGKERTTFCIEKIECGQVLLKIIVRMSHVCCRFALGCICWQIYNVNGVLFSMSCHKY